MFGFFSCSHFCFSCSATDSAQCGVPRIFLLRILGRMPFRRRIVQLVGCEGSGVIVVCGCSVVSMRDLNRTVIATPQSHDMILA